MCVDVTGRWLGCLLLYIFHSICVRGIATIFNLFHIGLTLANDGVKLWHGKAKFNSLILWITMQIHSFFFVPKVIYILYFHYVYMFIHMFNFVIYIAIVSHTLQVLQPCMIYFISNPILVCLSLVFHISSHLRETRLLTKKYIEYSVLLIQISCCCFIRSVGNQIRNVKQQIS